MTRKWTYVAVWAGFLLVGLAGCSHGTVVDPLVPFTQVSGQVAINDDTTRLLVENCVGSVTVLADAGHGVRIDADVRIRQRLAGTTAKGGFADHVKATVSNGTVRVANAHTCQPDEREWGMSLVVRIPAGLSVEANNAVGNIEVEGTQANLELVSGTGDVTVQTQRAGRVEGKSGTGDVKVTVAAVDGPVHLESGTGSVVLAVTGTPPTRDVTLRAGTGGVRLKIPCGSPGRFRMGTATGSIRITNHPGIHVTKLLIGGEAKGTVGVEGPTYRLRTGTGSIHAE